VEAETPIVVKKFVVVKAPRSRSAPCAIGKSKTADRLPSHDSNAAIDEKDR
jgi:hypothetical protein